MVSKDLLGIKKGGFKLEMYKTKKCLLPCNFEKDLLEENQEIQMTFTSSNYYPIEAIEVSEAAEVNEAAGI